MKTLSAYISKTTALLIIFFSGIVLAGWFLNIPVLTTGFFSGVSMRFNAALCLLLSGIIAYLIDVPEINPMRKIVITVLSSIVLLIALLTYLQFAFGWNLGIDELFLKDEFSSFRGRMGYIVSFDLILTSITFLLLMGKRKAYVIVQIFLFIIFLNSAFIVINNYIGYSFLYNIYYLNHTAYPVPFFLFLLIIAVSNNKQCVDMKLPFSRKLFGFFITFLILLSLIFYADFVNSKKRIESDKSIVNSYEIIKEAAQLKINIDALQNKTRGYIIAGAADYMPDFGIMKNSIDTGLNKLLMLTAGNNLQKQRIDSINFFVEKYIASRINLINLRHQKSFIEARKKFLDGEGLLLTDKINLISKNFLQDETQLLTKQKTENELFITNTSKIILLFRILVVLLIITMLIMILNYQRIKNQEENIIKQNFSLTNSVFESIHNGILVVDQKGKVIKTNDTFTKMWQIPEDVLKWKDDKILLNAILDQLSDPDKFMFKVNELYEHSDAESLDEINFKDGRVFERVSKPMLLDNKTLGRIWAFLDIT